MGATGRLDSEGRGARRARAWSRWAALAVGLAAAGCAGGDDEGWPPEGDTTAPGDVDAAPEPPSPGESDTGTTPTPDADPVGPDTAPGGADGASDASEEDTAAPLAPASELGIPEGCNPLAFAVDCLLPYPSDYFTEAAPELPTGSKVHIPPAAQLRTVTGVSFDLVRHRVADGFSPHMPIMAVFADGVSQDGLVFHLDDPALSLRPDNTTVLLDADTGELIPHWAEVDPAASSPAGTALLLRSYVRLRNGGRYIVALQDLLDAEGRRLSPPDGFAHVLYGQAEGNDELEALASRFEAEVFPALAEVGVERAGLQLAWDFTVGSLEQDTRDLLRVRELALAIWEQQPPAATVTSLKYNTSDQIAIRVEGELTVPLFLTEPGPTGLLHREPSGEVTQNGYAQVPFLLQVPHSVVPEPGEALEPARMIQYGHGFFGLREEINYGFMRGFTLEQRYAAAAVDWWGMSDPDVNTIIVRIGADPSGVFLFTERLHQGYVNQLALTKALRHTIPELSEVALGGVLTYDPEQIYWYGISQGAILGAVFAALSPDLDRFVLGVGGGPYSLMMSRSGSFGMLFTVLSSALGDPLMIQKFIATSQHFWDLIGPISWAPLLLDAPLPDTPARRVLLHMGVGDHSVPNLSSELHARALGVPMLAPSPIEVYGLDTTRAPLTDGSAFVAIDYQLEALPGIYAGLPSDEEKNKVHEDVRRNPAIKAQIDAFFQPDGAIEHFCDGPCDPE